MPRADLYDSVEATVEKPSAAVAAALSRHQEVGSHLESAISELERRLEMVLRPQQPTEAPVRLDEVRAAASPLTHELRALHSHFEIQRDRVVGLLDRLEI